jgi:hypothetical protein
MLNKKGFQDRRSPFFYAKTRMKSMFFLICGFLFFVSKIMLKNALKMGYTKKIPKKFEKSAKFPLKKHQKIINF